MALHNADQNSEVVMELKFVDIEKGAIIESKVYVSGVFTEPGLSLIHISEPTRP